MTGPCHTDEGIFDNKNPADHHQARLRAYRRHAVDGAQNGVADRRVFTEKLREELERRSRSFPNFSLLFVHIRSVTLCNDICGFLTNSHIIDTVAAKLRRRLRTADILIRSGGHGFVVFLSKASTASANAVATRLTTLINNTDFFYESVAFQIKLRVTVGSVQAEDTVETILARADRFLLEQKREDGFPQGNSLDLRMLG